jgi:hypothetical protein
MEYLFGKRIKTVVSELFSGRYIGVILTLSCLNTYNCMKLNLTCCSVWV